MTPTGKCFICKTPILVVAMDTKTLALEPDGDLRGNVEVRRSGLGWRGRRIGKGTPPTTGWEKFGTHDCPGPEAAA